MLVVDFAHQFLQHILHGDDAFRAAELVHDDDHMGFGALEQLQQLADLQCGGCPYRRHHDLLNVRAAIMAAGVVVLLMQDAHHMIHILMVHGHPGIAGLPEEVGSLLHGGSVLQGSHIHPGSQDAQHILVVELNGGADQLALVGVHVALALGLVHHGHQLILNEAFALSRLEDAAE